MIAYLQGVLLSKRPPACVINVNGIGYECMVPMSTYTTLPLIGQEFALYIHMVVREDEQRLFGFNSEAERDVFRILIKVNGIGPKVALAILSSFSVAELITAVVERQVSRIISVPGIGKKTAERLLIECVEPLQKYKLRNHELTNIIGAQDPGVTVVSKTGSAALLTNYCYDEAVAALVALGYKEVEANNRLGKIINSLSEADLNTEQLIKSALSTTTAKTL